MHFCCSSNFILCEKSFKQVCEATTFLAHKGIQTLFDSISVKKCLCDADSKFTLAELYSYRNLLMCYHHGLELRK